MGLKPQLLPENVRRCMPQETRKELGVKTSAEIDAALALKSEKELQKHVRNLLSQRNIWCDVSRMDQRTTNVVGRPDFIFAVNGRSVAFECKYGQGELSDEQQREKQKMEANGWRYYVIRSVEQAQAILNQLGAV